MFLCKNLQTNIKCRIAIVKLRNKKLYNLDDAQTLTVSDKIVEKLCRAVWFIIRHHNIVV